MTARHYLWLDSRMAHLSPMSSRTWVGADDHGAASHVSLDEARHSAVSLIADREAAVADTQAEHERAYREYKQAEARLAQTASAEREAREQLHVAMAHALYVLGPMDDAKMDEGRRKALRAAQAALRPLAGMESPNNTDPADYR